MALSQDSLWSLWCPAAAAALSAGGGGLSEPGGLDF